MTAESAGPGKGARFYLRLPLLAGAARAAPIPAVSARLEIADRKACKRVLIVEDNADTADTLMQALLLAGHEVEVARDGKERIA